MTTLRIVRGIFLLAPLVALAGGRGLGFDPEKHPEKALGMFLAPENRLIFKMRQADGVTRDFERNYAHPGRLDSVGGWHGEIRGDRVRVMSPLNLPGGGIEYLFKRGRLVGFNRGEVKKRFPYDAERPARPEEESPALRALVPASEKTKAQIEREYASKWVRSGRLQFPYANPNRSALFYGEVLLFLLMGALASRTKRLRAVALVLAGIGLVAMALAQSRGALLGLAVGLVPFVCVVRAKIVPLLRRRMTWMVLTVLIVLAVAWLATIGSRFLTRGFKGGSSWSNQLRVELMHNAPMMVADAPDGWGKTGFEVGRAYLDWYQPLNVVALTGSLINDHLTYLAAFGRLGRFLYVSMWLAALGIGGLLLFRRRNPLPLAETLLLGVTASFNPVVGEWTLLVMPALSFAAVPWHREAVRMRPYVWALVVAAIGAIAIVSGVTILGESMQRSYVRVKHDGQRVLVKGMLPQTWIVNDGITLGGVLGWKDVREYYVHNPHADAVGCVNDIDCLPIDVNRLVLTGSAGDAWLKKITSDSSARKRLPKSVVFIGAPFPPSAIPPPLFKACAVTYVVGEFMSRCTPAEYKDAPKWVKIVPGMDLYIANWMDYAMGE